MAARCIECGFDEDDVTAVDVAEQLSAGVSELSDAVAAVGEVPCPVSGCWTAIEYGGHVRDMLIVQRERILHARTVDTPPITPMGRDDRVAWGEYDGLTATAVTRQLGDAADNLARTLRRLGPAEWDRRVIYNYPVRSERTLLWVAAHTVHEVVHHTFDVRRHLPGADRLGHEE
jgi:hypothetical protein